MVTAASADTGIHVYCKWLKLAKLAQCICGADKLLSYAIRSLVWKGRYVVTKLRSASFPREIVKSTPGASQAARNRASAIDINQIL